MKTRKVLSLLLTLVLAVSLVSVLPVTAGAADEKLDTPAIQLNDKYVIWRPVDNAQRYDTTLLYRLEGAGEAVAVRVLTDVDYDGTITKASAYIGNSSTPADVTSRIQYFPSMKEYILNMNDLISYYYAADYRGEIRATANGYTSSDIVSTDKISGKDLANGYSTPYTLAGKVILNSDSGKYAIGSKVNAVCTGSTLDEVPSSELQYAWMYRDGESGTEYVIPGASGNSYTIENPYDNKQICVAVTSTKRSGIVYSKWITVSGSSSIGSYTVTVIDDGKGTGSASPASGTDGTIVTLTATPNPGYTFKEWVRTAGKLSGGLDVPNATSATTSFTISGYNVEVMATFEKSTSPTHTVIPDALNVQESPSPGSAQIGGVTSGREVTVVETQGEWSKIVYGTGYGWVLSKYLTPIDDTNPTVTETNHTVTVVDDGNGTGSASPASGPDGTVVTLTATPNPGYTFKEWVRTAGMLSGELDVPNATSATTSFTISGYDVEVKATFEENTSDISNPFVDVSESDLWYDAVLWAYYAEPQVTNGVDDTHFGPAQTVTRGQCAAFLWRAMGEPEPTITQSPFVDVPSWQYYYKPILWAVEKEITQGTDDTHFSPDQTLSTAHIITFLFRAKNPGADGWYEGAAAWAEQGYGTGKPFGVNTSVDPETNCPRGYVVMFLQQAK